MIDKTISSIYQGDTVLRNKIIQRRLLSYISPYKGSIVIAMGCSLIVTLCELARIQILTDILNAIKALEGYRQSVQPISIQLFYTEGFFEGYEIIVTNVSTAIRFFLWMLGGIVGLMFFQGVFVYWSDFLMERVGNKISLYIRNELYGRIIYAPLDLLTKQHSGDIMTRVTEDVRILQQSVAATASILRASIKVVIFLSAMLYKNIQMTILSLIILPLIAYLISRIGSRVREASTEIQERSSDIYTQLKETLSGINIIKSFTAENVEKERFQSTTTNQYNSAIRRARFASLLPPVIDWMAAIGSATVFGFACWQVIDGRLNIGWFAGYILLVGLMYKPIKTIGSVNNVLQQSIASAERVFLVADFEEEQQHSIKGKDDLKHIEGNVEFQNVSFSYADNLVINNINFSVKHGEVIALVGHSGSGKTTIVNLLQGFYTPESGNIFIDNTPINQVSLKSLRQNIALVPQETFLFDGTVLENIQYGSNKSTRSDVINAAIKANADGFIRKMPNGYDTSIGEAGGYLSGGEKQRISIARAILKDAPILVLDEATSSLDTHSEAIIQESLSNLMKGRTSFVIAHRLTTVMGADRIMVINDGKIAEAGTHDSLMAKNGIYRKLCEQQIFA